MSRLITSLLLLVLLGGVLLVPSPQMVGMAQESETPTTSEALMATPLDACRRGAFSTEEDFMMTKGEPFDGNPYISDGDLLSFTGQVCARNASLLSVFYVGVVPPDLGLDAADILDFSDRLIAFATELDDPAGRFTAGDLLATNGAIIPNVALVKPFGINYDVGLDAIQFMGDMRSIINFLNEARTIGRAGYIRNPELLIGQLRQWNIDIWFSVEGTYRAGERSILDGDLLSARGTVIATNADLFPNSVPAGIPNRGVDFGLDAVTGSRSLTRDVKDVLKDLRFSTEILFNGEPGFTDGDVLRYQDGIAFHNRDLIAPFYPAADFLGLDALWLQVDVPPTQSPNLQTMCGNRSLGDFWGGYILPDEAAGSGLYNQNLAVSPPGSPPRQPCGEYVPIDGFLPAANVKRFRVAFRPAADLTVPAVGAATGIRTNWLLNIWDSSAATCLPTGNLNTDANGWMNAADYLEAKAGGPSTGWCSNSHLRLAVWDSANHAAGFGPPDANGHYRLWLEWEDAGAVLHREPFDHSIQLDNKNPTISELKVTLADGTTPVPACGKAPKGSSVFKVYARFADDYYWGYHFYVRGGNPPASLSFGWHNYYDGTPEVVNTDDTGTIPDGSTVLLRSFDLTAMGSSFVDCCYVLDLHVRDASIRHTFNGYTINDGTGADSWWAYSFITFAAAP